MSLQPEIVVLVLIAALLHAAWNAVVKASPDRFLTQTVLLCTGGTLCAAIIPWVGLPDRSSWVYLGCGILIHNTYYFFLLQAYRVGDLSHVYPLARGVAPLIVAILSGAVVGETLSATDVAGILLVSLGILSLAFDRGRGNEHGNLLPVLWAVGTGLLIAAYTLVDGLGVRQSGSRLAYIVWLQCLDPLPLAVAALVFRRRQIRPFLRTRGRAGVAGGVMALAAYSLVLWAYSLGAMAGVAALRETSVIFAALIGAALLGEPFGRRRVAVATMVAMGVIVFNLPG